MTRLVLPICTALLVLGCDSDSGSETSATGSTTSSSTTSATDSTSATATASSSDGSTGGSGSSSATTSTSTTGMPVEDCAAETERTACLALNEGHENPACAWVDVVPVGDGCAFGGAESECIALSHAGSCEDPNTCAGGPGDDLWWREGANGIELFQFTYCEDRPIGWNQCAWEAGAGPDDITPAACACACP